MTPLWILLLLQLPLTREQAIYARKGHPQELPCGLDKALLGAEELIWSYNGGGNQQSKMLFRVMADRPPKRQPDAWDNLSVLRNHSLYLRVAEDSDTGTYWCTAPGANQHYYELAVVTGTHMVLAAGRANATCHQFSCALSVPLTRAALAWWVDGQRVQEDDKQRWLRVFWGPQTALLQACWERKEIGDPHAQARKGQVWCELKDTRVTFKPTVEEPPTPPAGRTACSSTWIPLAVGVALEFFIIIILGAALWRQRWLDQGLKLGDRRSCTTPDPPGPKWQLYENVGLGQPPPDGAGTMPGSLPP